ncbi:MAG: lysylphosphatidylglycerol synthase transmembrane domain-containing protein [Aggregatilineales bacterium]
MGKYRKQFITGIAIILVIYIVLLIFLDSGDQFDGNVLTEIRRFPLWLVPLLCLTQVSAGAFRFWEWQYYLGVIDARDKVSIKDSLIIFVSAFTMVVSPGKAAEVLKSVFLKMKTGIPIARSAPIVVAERVVDGLAVIVTLLVTMLIAQNQLDLGSYESLSRGVIFTSAILIGAGLVVVQIAPLAYFCLGLLKNFPILYRLQQPLTEFYESSREIFNIRHVIPTTAMGMGVYASSTLGFMLVLYGFGLAWSPELLLQVAFIVGVSSAVGALSFVPNGAGVTEVTNLGMLLALVAPAHPELTPAVAGAAALMQGFFHKWFRVLVGMAVTFIYRNWLFTSDLDAEISQLDENVKVDKGSPILTTD